jgi:hypothetical protein
MELSRIAGDAVFEDAAEDSPVSTAGAQAAPTVSSKSRDFSFQAESFNAVSPHYAVKARIAVVEIGDDKTGVDHFAWRHHCRGLFQMPRAA